MIINTGGRTDTVQYYTEWLLNRIKEGYVLSRNPMFRNKIMRYELTPTKVDCLLFCSKNYAPILPHFADIAQKFNVYCHYTITPYGRDVEPGVPSIDDSIATLINLSTIIGSTKIAWRYDPVLLTKYYTIDEHIHTFNYIAKSLSPYIDRCIFSFVEIYKKLAYNMPELIPLSTSDIDRLAQALGQIAAQYNLRIQTCGTNGDFTQYGIHSSGCATLPILGQANNVAFRTLAHKGMRHGCHCIESRDIGEYDTCMNGCKYCYANKNPKIAFDNYKKHNPLSPILIGDISPHDTITIGRQNSFLQKNDEPLLF